MKRWTIAVGFDWKNSDDGKYDYAMHDETRYLVPANAREGAEEVFVLEEDLDASNTYVSREEAEKDFAWLKDMYDRWWNGGWAGDKPIFPEEISGEFPDNCAEFIYPSGVIEVEVIQ